MRKHFLTISLMTVLSLGANSMALTQTDIETAANSPAKDLPVKMPENFSMTMTIRNLQTDEEQMTSQIQKLGDQQRVDVKGGSAVPMGGMGEMYIITNIETGDTVAVMVAQKMIMPMNLNALGMEQGTLKEMMMRAEQMTFEKLGEETVNSTETVKYKATHPNGKELLMWIDDTVDFPVKIVAEDQNVAIFYSDVSFDAPDPAVFELPQGYNQIDGDLLKGLMQNLPQGQ